MGNYYGTGSMMTGGFWIWLVGCVGFVFFVLVVVGILFVFFGLLRRKNRAPHLLGESPMEILNRRYAAGEVSKKDYDACKKDLEGK